MSIQSNNKIVLIDNILNYVPDTTDKEKLERIQEILNLTDCQEGN